MSSTGRVGADYVELSYPQCPKSDNKLWFSAALTMEAWRLLHSVLWHDFYIILISAYVMVQNCLTQNLKAPLYF